MSTATAERRASRRDYVPGSHPEIAPEHERLAAELAAIERAEQAAVLAADHTAAKIATAQETLAHAWSFNGEKLSGFDALERGYSDYIEALEALAGAAEVLGHIGPDIRHAHRVLADAGLIEGAAPEPISVRASLSFELRNLRERAFRATAGDL
jgi:hypothetical protein